MNQKQKLEAIKLLSADCELKNFYILGRKTCAISSQYMADVANSISKRFGLSVDKLGCIQDYNDQEYITQSRRKAVVEYVKSL